MRLFQFLFLSLSIVLTSCVEDIEEETKDYGISMELENQTLRYAQNDGDITKNRNFTDIVSIYGTTDNIDFLQMNIPSTVATGTHILEDNSSLNVSYRYRTASGSTTGILYGEMTIFELSENPLVLRANFSGEFVAGLWVNGVWVNDTTQLISGVADVRF